MRLLIVAASRKEVVPLLTGREINKGRNPDVIQWTTHLNQVDVVITGVGMVPTVYWVTRMLNINAYDYAINAGICGSFNKNFPIGQVYHVIEDSFPEVGAEDDDDFLSLRDLRLSDLNEFPYSDGIISNPFKGGNSIVDALPGAKSVTVNTVHGKEKSIRILQERIHCDLETMEGAAFFFACKMQNIPCFQIRAVSNYVERRNSSAWNIPLAVENLNQTLIQVLYEWKCVTL